MILSETYQLIYDGAGRHYIAGLTKSKIFGNYVNATNNRRMAEYFLEKVKFDAAIADKAKHFKIGDQSISSNREANYLQHLHHAKSAEIRSK